MIQLNLKSLVQELIKVYSSEKSFFSKKRIESSIAFIIGQIGMITFLIMKLDTLSTYDIILWATLEFTVAGYMINKIEKNKLTN
jgi:hypothetical protein